MVWIITDCSLIDSIGTCIIMELKELNLTFIRKTSQPMGKVRCACRLVELLVLAICTKHFLQY